MHGACDAGAGIGPVSACPRGGGRIEGQFTTREPRGRRTGLILLAVFLVSEVAFVVASVLIVVPFVLFGARDQGLPPGALVASVVVPAVLAAVVAVAGTALFAGGDRVARVRRELAARWNWRHLKVGLAIGAVGLVVTVPASVIWAETVGRDHASSAVGEVFAGRHLGVLAGVTMFVGVWLVAPLCEELIFRGVLWSSLEHWRWNRWLILLVTSVVFSVAHLEVLRSPLLLVLSIPIGLARMYTGNVLASIVTHQVNNFLPAVALLFATTGWVDVDV
ncbi:CPBP family intramembrane glutamic endopeptidase [Haloechinothrix aidingensis]|uniref:CPBP family intramembrane glutamic endopeptidase n=1 Tax=Haloechinothrix aidingensis TaxID=2752311 RepID=UPI0031B621FF